MPQCRNCNTIFPNWITINEKRINLQKRKFCTDCSPYPSTNRQPVLRKLRYCSRCDRDESQTDFHKSTQITWCKQCHNQSTVERSRKNKQRCVDHLGGKCSICNYSKCLTALEFHHTDPSEKDFTVSDIRNRSFEVVKSEIDKCILVCANCHRELHEQLKVSPPGLEPGIRR